MDVMDMTMLNILGSQSSTNKDIWPKLPETIQDRHEKVNVKQ